MRAKMEWVVGAAFCFLCFLGFVLVLNLGNRASTGVRGSGEMLHVPRPEDLGPLVPTSPSGVQASIRHEGAPPSPSRTLEKIGPSPEEAKRMEREGVVFN